MEEVIFKSEIKKAQARLKKNLLENRYKRQVTTISTTGGSVPNMVTYFFPEQDIWWAPRLMKEEVGEVNRAARFWNAFGIGDPLNNGNRSPVVEINFPESGRNRRIAGVLLQDGNDVFMYHTGKIGGGRKGVGKQGFYEHYKGAVHQVDVNGEVEDMVPFGSIDDPLLIDTIAHFVHEVLEIKQRCVSSEYLEDLEFRRGHQFNPEFFGMKNYQKKSYPKTKYPANHGRVLNALQKKLEELGVKTANTQLIDLYTYKGNEITMLFELKSGLSRQTIYTAIGQLLLHATGRRRRPKMVFVVPETLPLNLAHKIKALDIITLRYALDGRQVNFYGLPQLLKLT